MDHNATKAVAPRDDKSVSLYVGDLHPEVTEAILFNALTHPDADRNLNPNPNNERQIISGIASIRICRDAVTRDSLKYGYINFHSSDLAAKALEQLNGTPIYGKICRAMWSNRDPSSRKSSIGNIFIRNLNKSIDVPSLKDTLCVYGDVLSVKIVEGEKGSNHAYVHFSSSESAERAIKEVDGKKIMDKIVTVAPFVPKKSRSPTKFTNVYVKDIPTENFSTEDLQKMFEKFGKITSAQVMMESDKSKDPNSTEEEKSKKSRGFGFVNFAENGDAEKAIEALNGTQVGDKKIYVGKAEKKSEREESLRRMHELKKREQMDKNAGVNLYIKNLPDDIEGPEGLIKMFKEFGTISSAKVMKDANDRPKGFGFVSFENRDEASRAMNTLNNSIGPSNKRLYVGLAQTKEARKMHLEAQRSKYIPGMQGMRMPGMPGMYNPMFYQPGPPHSYNMNPSGVRRPPMSSGYMLVNNGGAVRGGAGGMPVRRQKHRNTRTQPAQSVEREGEDQKTMLGEQLYAIISSKDRDLNAGKITGMILDSSSSEEITKMLNNPKELEAKINEAKTVLSEHLKANE